MSEPTKALRAYQNQRRKARNRGIAWEFDFDSWLKWWGDDLTKRGARKSTDLQMLRHKDSGPYAPWNVRKGSLSENLEEKTSVGTQRRLRVAKEVRKESLPMWLKYVANDGFLTAKEVSGLTGFSIDQLAPCNAHEVALPPNFPSPVNIRRQRNPIRLNGNARKWAWKAGDIKRWLVQQGS